MLTNPEDRSPPADVCKSPSAGAAEEDSPSQLLGAFIDYLRARPISGDSEGTVFDSYRAARIRGRQRTLGGLLQDSGRPMLGVGSFAVIDLPSAPLSAVRRRLD